MHYFPSNYPVLWGGLQHKLPKKYIEACCFEKKTSLKVQSINTFARHCIRNPQLKSSICSFNFYMSFQVKQEAKLGWFWDHFKNHYESAETIT